MGHLLKIKRIQKFKETGHRKYIYRNELDKACFQHDMAYGDFKDLAKGTTPDKVLRNKAFNIAKNLKYDGYQRGLASLVYKFFDRKSSGSGIKNEIKQNGQSSEELHKPIIKKILKRRVYSSFKVNIWGADLADVQLISKFIKGIMFLLCVIDTFRKYVMIQWNYIQKENQIKYGQTKAVNFTIDQWNHG